MQRYIFGRLGQAVVTLLALSLAVFLAVHVAGNPVVLLLGQGAGEDEIAAVEKRLGLDQPLYVQYALFLTKAVQGDFGKSIVSNQPARDLLIERLPATAQLAGGAFILEIVVGILLGVLSAVKRDSLPDLFGKFLAILGIAAPNFWIAIMSILLFGAMLGWLPTYGSGSPKHLILPVLVLGWHGMAGMVRLVRSSMLEVLDSEYVKFARIKGMPERIVVYKHALKNALIPVLTFAGLSLAGLLNGSVVVESVFAWPGVGRLMFEGISHRDIPVVQATVLTAGGLYITLSLIVDVLYAYVDPRIRYH